MPTSPLNNVQQIMSIVMDLRPYPSRILDIGIGYGKYGFLCKEYISFWNSPHRPRNVVVDGVEAFEEYIGDLQKKIYDNIFHGDASEVLPKLPNNSYDVVLLIDVLEHFDQETGRKVIAQCKRIGRLVIVSTPQKFWPQGDSWGNPFERHKSLWSKKDLLALGASQVLNSENWVAIFANAPYADRFSINYRLWRKGNQWTPDWLRPCARWVFRKVVGRKQGISQTTDPNLEN